MQVQTQLCEASSSTRLFTVACRAPSLFNTKPSCPWPLTNVDRRACLTSAPLLFKKSRQELLRCCYAREMMAEDDDGASLVDGHKDWDAQKNWNVDRRLFDRTEELAFLKRFVRSTGRNFLLLSGPRNCGKSAILSQIAEEEKDRVVLVSLRMADISSPEGFLKEVQNALIAADSTGEFRKFLKTALKNVQETLGTLSGNAQAGFEHPRRLKAGITLAKSKAVDQHVNFQKVFAGYLQEHPGKCITLIIDEANMLQGWLLNKVSDKTLDSYLSFFVYITKEKRLANVILVSSDFFLKFWLNEKIGSDRYVSHIIGDFPERDARKFFEFVLGKPCQDNTWKCVYGVFGGAPLPLRMIAEAMLDDAIGWKEVVLQLYFQMQEQTDLGLSPECIDPRAIPPSWSKEEYLEILTEMCKCENGVVPWNQLLKFGKKVLKALICYNLIQYRTKSFLAKDVDWYEGRWPVVMPLSRLHWLTVKHLVSMEQGYCKFGWKELMVLAGVREEDQKVGLP